MREEVRSGPWAAERARLHAELGPAGWSARWQSTGGRLWDGVQLLTARIGAGTVEAFAATEVPARPASPAAVPGAPAADMLPGFEGVAAPSAAPAAPGETAPRTAATAAAATGTAEAGPVATTPAGAPEAPAGSGSVTTAPADAPEPPAGSGSPTTAPAARVDPKKQALARVLLLDAVQGQQDAAWLSAFEVGPGSPLEGVAAVARAAGWWWPYERVAVVCERPVELHRDEAGRLDRADGPALAYRDGFALYSWRGMPVPGGFLRELSALTPERIRTEENAELRRVMLEHYGYDRYLTESGAVPEHRDETGVLWRIALQGDEDTVMVEVVNSTPEPDGTTRTYWLRVPPTTLTAREGVAWTFGLTAEEYQPQRQT
nr:hypothetical protein [Actinacidiphila guanduensis]